MPNFQCSTLNMLTLICYVCQNESYMFTDYCHFVFYSEKTSNERKKSKETSAQSQEDIMWVN